MIYFSFFYIFTHGLTRETESFRVGGYSPRLKELWGTSVVAGAAPHENASQSLMNIRWAEVDVIVD